MNTPLRVLGYTRVSTGEQAESGLGLIAQDTTIRQAADRNGWNLLDVICDEGVSGKDLGRPGLLKLLARASTENVDALAVAKLDRLTRSLVGLADLIAWGKRNSLALIALDLGLDTSTDTGRLVAQIMASVGEWERAQISERTRLAMAVRRRQGRLMGRPGVRDTNPELAARIHAERAEDLTWQAIADRLNEEAVPTIRGGSEWRVSAVQSAAGYVRPAPKEKRVILPDPPRRRRTTRGGPA